MEDHVSDSLEKMKLTIEEEETISILDDGVGVVRGIVEVEIGRASCRERV